MSARNIPEAPRGGAGIEISLLIDPIAFCEAPRGGAGIEIEQILYHS